MSEEFIAKTYYHGFASDYTEKDGRKITGNQLAYPLKQARSRSKKIAREGVKPSEFGQYGPGVYATKEIDHAGYWGSYNPPAGKKSKVRIALIDEKVGRKRFTSDATPFPKTPGTDKESVPVKRIQNENPTSAARRAANRAKRRNRPNGFVPDLPTPPPRAGKYLRMAEFASKFSKSEEFPLGPVEKALYHGFLDTSGRVARGIRKKGGLKPSERGSWGKGVYATPEMDTAAHYSDAKSGKKYDAVKAPFGSVWGHARNKQSKVAVIRQSEEPRFSLDHSPHQDKSKFPKTAVDDKKPVKVKRIQNENRSSGRRRAANRGKRKNRPNGETTPYDLFNYSPPAAEGKYLRMLGFKRSQAKMDAMDAADRGVSKMEFPLGPRLAGVQIKGTKCILWPGAVRNGYGVKKVSGTNTTVPAHKYVWEQKTGKKVPKGWHIDHLCRNKLCINPKHLEPISPSGNKERAWAFKLGKYKHKYYIGETDKGELVKSDRGELVMKSAFGVEHSVSKAYKPTKFETFMSTPDTRKDKVLDKVEGVKDRLTAGAEKVKDTSHKLKMKRAAKLARKAV